MEQLKCANLFSFDETNNLIKNQAPDVVINAPEKLEV